jgi:hypothetical protein
MQHSANSVSYKVMLLDPLQAAERRPILVGK